MGYANHGGAAAPSLERQTRRRNGGQGHHRIQVIRLSAIHAAGDAGACHRSATALGHREHRPGEGGADHAGPGHGHGALLGIRCGDGAARPAGKGGAGGWCSSKGDIGASPVIGYAGTTTVDPAKAAGDRAQTRTALVEAQSIGPRRGGVEFGGDRFARIEGHPALPGVGRQRSAVRPTPEARTCCRSGGQRHHGIEGVGLGAIQTAGDTRAADYPRSTARFGYGQSGLEGGRNCLGRRQAHRAGGPNDGGASSPANELPAVGRVGRQSHVAIFGEGGGAGTAATDPRGGAGHRTTAASGDTQGMGRNEVGGDILGRRHAHCTGVGRAGAVPTPARKSGTHLWGRREGHAGIEVVRLAAIRSAQDPPRHTGYTARTRARPTDGQHGLIVIVKEQGKDRW